MVVFKAVEPYPRSGSNSVYEFQVWQTRVKDLLTLQGISAALKKKKPDKMDDNEWEEKQEQAAATIRMCISDHLLHNVRGLRTPKEIWDKLESEFGPKEEERAVPERWTEMEEGSDLAEHIYGFRRRVADEERAGVAVSDDDKVVFLLCSLPSLYNPVIEDLLCSEDSITFEDTIVGLLAWEQSRG